MRIKWFPVFLSGLLCVVSASCAGKIGAEDQAKQALQLFLDHLSRGEYSQAAEYYGGNYDVLVSTNPAVNPSDYATLWKQACEMNGFQCLETRSVTFQEVNQQGEYVFEVQFNDRSGERFVLGPCCGEETPQQLTDFIFRVVEVNQVFKVLDLPVYVP